MVNIGNRKHYAFLSLIVIVMLIIWLIISSIPSFNSIQNSIFITQGDNHFYIVNTGDEAIVNNVSSIHEKFIFGSTYFKINQIEYLGYIEAFELANSNGYRFSFKYITFHNLSEIVEVKLSIEPAAQEEITILKGLTVHYNNGQPIFTSIISQGTKQADTLTNLLQFSLNGSLLDIIEYSISNYTDARIIDVSYFKENEYIILTTLGSAENFEDFTNHVAICNFDGTANHVFDLKHQYTSITSDPNNGRIYTSTSANNDIDQWNSSGYFERSIPIWLYPAEIDILNSDSILIREYQYNYNNDFPFVNRGFGVTLLILTVSFLFCIYILTRKSK